MDCKHEKPTPHPSDKRTPSATPRLGLPRIRYRYPRKETRTEDQTKKGDTKPEIGKMSEIAKKSPAASRGSSHVNPLNVRNTKKAEARMLHNAQQAEEKKMPPTMEERVSATKDHIAKQKHLKAETENKKFQVLSCFPFMGKCFEGCSSKVELNEQIENPIDDADNDKRVADSVLKRNEPAPDEKKEQDNGPKSHEESHAEGVGEHAEVNECEAEYEQHDSSEVVAETGCEHMPQTPAEANYDAMCNIKPHYPFDKSYCEVPYPYARSRYDNYESNESPVANFDNDQPHEEVKETYGEEMEKWKISKHPEEETHSKTDDLMIHIYKGSKTIIKIAVPANGLAVMDSEKLGSTNQHTCENVAAAKDRSKPLHYNTVPELEEPSIPLCGICRNRINREYANPTTRNACTEKKQSNTMEKQTKTWSDGSKYRVCMEASDRFSTPEREFIENGNSSILPDKEAVRHMEKTILGLFDGLNKEALIRINNRIGELLYVRK